ncbi:MAG: divalent metal cation transporter [Chloroflexi bacterium]|nr:divalent metal cation transporter [Chloroflexota bacterium]
MALLRRSVIARLVLFLSVMGPGIITANVDNDAGGIATYSLAGANFGYSLLWSLIPVALSLIIIQEMCARMGAVTGKGLAGLIRENFGVRTTFLLMLALLFVNLANTMAEFSGLAAGGEIFGVSRHLTVPLGAALVWFVVVKGTYGSVEKVFLVASTFYITYIISGFLAEPRWGDVLTAIARPTVHFEPAYVMMLVGIVGTTIAPWMQFYNQSAVVEKGVTADECRYTQLDVVVGSIAAVVVVFFIVVACGATIFASGLRVDTVSDAALALGPLAGKYAAALFALGLINASLFSASVLPLSTSYSVCEALGFEAGVSKGFREAPIFFGLYTAMIALGALMMLWPNAPLLQIMYLSQVANGILLPYILISILLLVNKKSIMGSFTNPRWLNVAAWGVVGIVILLTLALVVSQVLSVLAPAP